MIKQKTELMCPSCGAGPFKGNQGLAVHKIRKHSAAGKTWNTPKNSLKGKIKREITDKKFKCDHCLSSYDSIVSLKQHMRRMHNVRTRPFIKRNKTVIKSESRINLKDALYNVLGRSEHSEGLPVPRLVAELKKEGYGRKAKARNIAGYIPTIAAKDPNLIRVERGMYRLKAGVSAPNNIPTAETTVPAVIEIETPPVVKEVSRDAVEIRNAHLEAQRNGLINALTALTRSMMDV